MKPFKFLMWSKKLTPLVFPVQTDFEYCNCLQRKLSQNCSWHFLYIPRLMSLYVNKQLTITKEEYQRFWCFIYASLLFFLEERLQVTLYGPGFSRHNLSWHHMLSTYLCQLDIYYLKGQRLQKQNDFHPLWHLNLGYKWVANAPPTCPKLLLSNLILLVDALVLLSKQIARDNIG